MFDADGVTAMLVHELAQVDGGRPPVRHAETATMLCLAGEISTAGGRTRIRAEFGAPEAAARLRDAIAAMYGREGVLGTAPGRDGTLRHSVGVAAPGTDLARATGLVDRHVRPVSGLPRSVLSGTATAAAVWRGALLAGGGLGRSRGRLQVQIECPGQAVALTLLDAARRLGLSVRDRETAARYRVIVHDPESIDMLIRTSGAPATADAVRGILRADPVAGASEPLDVHNAERAASAGAAAAERARQDLDVLGDAAPESLRTAGRLRADHAHLSLAQLGGLADPPLSRNALAARLRRLSAVAAEHTPQGTAGQDDVRR